jgi:type II secretory pathway component GspD/PulD (secretin)
MICSKTKGTIAGSVLALTAAIAGVAAGAQDVLATKPMTRTERNELQMNAPLTTFQLKNSGGQNDNNEILTGLRLMLDPSIKMYLVPKDNVIVLKALPDDLATAAKLIAELDRPRKTFRLTYTLTETDGGRPTSTRHFVMVAEDGQRTTLKSGEKVPVATGRYDVTNTISETQMAYLDVGYDLDATVTSTAGGASIKSKVERSIAPADKPVSATVPANSAASAVDPAILQSVLETVTNLPLGKPTLLGSLDVPDSTKHLEVQVTLEVVP